MNRAANSRNRPRRRQRQRDRRQPIVVERPETVSVHSKLRAALIEVERDWWERQP